MLKSIIVSLFVIYFRYYKLAFLVFFISGDKLLGWKTSFCEDLSTHKWWGNNLKNNQCVNPIQRVIFYTVCLATPLNCVIHTTDKEIEKARWWAMYTYSYNCVC